MRQMLLRLLRNEVTAWAVFALSVAMTVMAWFIADEYREREARQRFNQSAQRARLDIQKQMSAYEEVLRAGAGLFYSRDKVSRQEWKVFVAALQLDAAYPGIQGLGYAVMVSPAGKAVFEKSIRSEGFPSFAIYPSGPRSQYSAIIYLEPFDWRNRRAFGYDMYSNATRREAMQRARDTGEITISGSVILVQETNKDVQYGFLMYFPVYRHGMPVGTVAQRRAALQGFIYAAFRFGDLMHGILGEGLRQLDFSLYDGPAARQGARVYHIEALVTGAGEQSLRHPEFTADVPMELGGAQWLARFESSRYFEAQVDSIQPGLTAIGGLGADFMLFVALYTISKSGRLMARRNAELAASREALADERNRYERLVENVPGVVFRCDAKPPWTVHYISHYVEELSGIPTGDFTAGRARFVALVHDEDRPRVEAEIAEFVATGCAMEIEFRLRHLDGGWRWLLLRGIAQYGQDGEPLWLDGVAFDISERKKQELALRERDLRYRAVVETASDGFWLINHEGRLIGTNEAYCRMSGYSEAELLQLHVHDLEAVETIDEVAAHIVKVYTDGFDRFETRHRRKGGSEWPAEVTVSLLPQVGDMFVFVRDLTAVKALEAERAQAEAQIRKLAFLDPLTQLPNRRLLSDRLRQAMASSQRSCRHGALLFIDLDRFKELNDSLGHEMGDRLLIEVARRLKECVREEDTVARLGGDEFVIMLVNLPEGAEESVRQLRAVGSKILFQLNRVYELGSHLYHCTPSIGATLFLGEDEPVDTLFRCADKAMYQVKAAGRNGMRVFGSD